MTGFLGESMWRGDEIISVDQTNLCGNQIACGNTCSLVSWHWYQICHIWINLDHLGRGLGIFSRIGIFPCKYRLYIETWKSIWLCAVTYIYYMCEISEFGDSWWVLADLDAVGFNCGQLLLRHFRWTWITGSGRRFLAHSTDTKTSFLYSIWSFPRVMRTLTRFTWFKS